MTASRLCPACGAAEAVDARFCSRCGSPLGDAVRPERRALVSIVFCDVVGSTALGERLDAEVLRGVQARYFVAASNALREHGGQVEKYIGDAVMCVFGLPLVHEDDALRAVRGALDLAAGVEQLNVELRVELGVELAVRVGVNTGEVVAGDPSSGQALVTGDAVNTAARLEQAAPAGGILIGELTYRLVSGAVWAEPVAAISARGKAAPVQAWRLLGLVDRPAGLGPAESELVGRAGELAILQARLDQVMQERKAGLVLVSGEAGIGKSRLVAELVAQLPPGRALSGTCPSYGRGNTYRPLREVLEEVVPSVTEPRFIELFEGDSQAEVTRQRLLCLTGYAPGSLSLDEAYGAVARLFSALAAEAPLVVVFEDLHWAEPTFLDLLEFLTETLQAGVLLIGTTRDELFDERPGLRSAALQLGRLGREAAGALLSQRHALSVLEAEQVVARAGGNPLFLRQLGAALAEGMESVPPDLASLLAARLDRLDARDRVVLEAAGIVGRDFWPTALTSLLDDELDVRSQRESLQYLTAKEFVAGGASGALAGPTGLSGVFAGERMHIRHALLHDAVLSAMSKARRAELHERFAQDLAEHADHDPTSVGYHLEQAARLRMELRPRDAPPPSATAAAAELEQAGMQALQRDDAPAASLLLSRAKALVPEASSQAARIEDLLEHSLAPRLAAPTEELLPGDELAGFIIEGIAGRGGMAAVYRARDPQLERAVALKVIAPLLADDLSFRARFVRESRIAANIDHPSVIPVYAAGEENGRLYIAMRYVEGGDLAARLEERGAFAVQEAVEIVEKLASALDAAHALGLVHRDVKPANALLETAEGDRVYLTDFGLSSDRQALGGLTRVGQWVGTVAYSAPEQVRSEQVDARADIYALGGLLYTLLTGVIPFPVNSEAEALAAHLYDPPPRPSQRVRGIPRGLDAVVARAMDKDSARRYPSAGDLARAALAAARGDRLPRDHGSVASGAAAPRGGLRPATRARKRVDRRVAIGAITGLVAAIAAAIAAVLLAGSGGSGSSNPAGRLDGSPLALPVSPDRLAASPSGVIWAVQTSGGLLAHIDGRTRRVRAVPEPYDLGGRTHPAISAGVDAAWVASSAASVGGVDRVPDAGNDNGAIHVPLANASAVAIGANAVFATSNPGPAKTAFIVRINPKTGQITGRRKIGPGAVDIAIAAGDVWVALRQAGEVMRVDPNTLRVRKRIHLSAGISRLAADGANLWVLNKSARTVTRIATRSGTTIGVPIALGKELQDISAGGGSLWIAGSDRTLTRLGADGVQIGTPIAVGSPPLSVVSDGPNAWIASGGDNSISRVRAG